jgi:hypothetical protein
LFPPKRPEPEKPDHQGVADESLDEKGRKNQLEKAAESRNGRKNNPPKILTAIQIACSSVRKVKSDNLPNFVEITISHLALTSQAQSSDEIRFLQKNAAHMIHR